MNDELKAIRKDLDASKNKWQWLVALQIDLVPEGHLCTYGTIADLVNEEYGLHIKARNVAWLRRKLYALLTHKTTVALHRIAKVGDVASLSDSTLTKKFNDKLREVEGSLANPKWWPR